MDKNIKLEDMKWNDIDKISKYTGNNPTNKRMFAIDRPIILKGYMQFKENLNQMIRQLNAYDSSSILIGDTNWIKRNQFSKYMPKLGAPPNVSIGQICVIDFGKTYKNELSYIHPALCVGKNDNKYLVIPMTSGKNWITECFHPKINPDAKKTSRQALQTEGFPKNCVLLLNDAKYISGGRILELREIIQEDTLSDIQIQLAKVMFPNIMKSLEAITNINNELERKVNNLTDKSKKREKENIKLKNELKNLKSDFNDGQCINS